MSGESSDDGYSIVSLGEEKFEDVGKAGGNGGKTSSFLCPILNQVTFEDPVKAEDDITYERRGIMAWLESCEQRNLPYTSPCTRQIMGTQLIAQPDFRQKFGDLLDMLKNVTGVHELCEVFATLDSVRSLLQDKSLEGLEGLGQEGWQPPQIVFIGERCSGKSTLLERLAMMPIFPLNDNVCTKLPIHVRLRIAESCEPATLEVLNIRTNTIEDGPYVIPIWYGAVHVREKMEEIISKVHGAVDTGFVSSERIIILTIKRPCVPNIDLVDLPGLVQFPPELKESTNKIAEEHIARYGDKCVFVVTVNAMDTPSVNAAVQLIRSNKLEDRSIGVFTMCDQVSPIKGKKQLLMERLETPPPPSCGAEALDPHGWVCVMNYKADDDGMLEGYDCCNFSRLKQQAMAEEAFMRKHMPGAFDKGNAGCGALVERLSTLVVQTVRRTWGRKTVHQLGQALHEATLHNAALGLPAFHREESGHAAREAAASEAKARLEAGKNTLLRGCCRDVLSQLKSRLTAIVLENLVDVDASEFVERLQAQRERFEGACSDAVSQWGVSCVQAVTHMLKQRQTQAAAAADSRAGPKQGMEDASMQLQGVEGDASFELARFPSLIAAVEAHLSEMVGPAKASILEAVTMVADRYYGNMSLWMKEAIEIGGVDDDGDDGVSVSMICSVVGEVMLCFVQHGATRVFGALSSQVDMMCSRVPDSEWIESCAEEREELLLRITSLERAKSAAIVHIGDDRDEHDEAMIRRSSARDKSEGDAVAMDNYAQGKEKDELRQMRGFVGVVNDRFEELTVEGAEGVAVSAGGQVFVAVKGYGDYCVEVYIHEDRMETHFGMERLSDIAGIAIDCEGSIYVCSPKAHTVSIFCKGVSFKRQLGTGRGGRAPEHLYGPQAVAVDSIKNVYVCNSLMHTVSVFDAQGKYVRSIGNVDGLLHSGRLDFPSGVAVDHEGIVYVSSYKSNCVSVFSRQGEFLRRIVSEASSGLGTIWKPRGLAVDQRGWLYVCSEEGNHVSLFDQKGVFDSQIPCNKPRHVAIDGKGQVLISEPARVYIVRS